MTGWHEVWHVTVLATSLFGGASVALVLLAPFLFDPVPEGFARARNYLLGLGGIAVILLALEWLAVH